MGNILKTLKFKRMGATPTIRTVVPNHLIPEDSPHKEHPNRRYATNKIETTKYSIWSFIPKNLFEQFHRFANLYFVFIVLLNWVPAVNAFGKEVAMIPLVFVLCVTALKDAFEDYRRYKSDKKINNLGCRIYSRNESKYVRKKWADIKVGDFVHLSCNEVIPADIILLHSSDDSGICHIDTSNLDGENNLKQRQIVWGLRTGDDFKPSMFSHTVECEMPNMQIYKFNGAILNTTSGDKVPVSRNNILLRGCIIRNTDFVEGICVYAGHDTKALMNNRGPRHKRSKLERNINRDVIWCVVALFLMCFMCSLGAGLWQEHFEDARDLYFIPYEDEDRYNSAYHAFLIFWTYVILFQVMIPISLYVTIEFVKLGQVYFMQEDIQLYYEPSDKRIECRALNITEDLGQIEYIFSDKTGTLTENMMVFKRCSIAGTDYFPPTEAKEVDEDGVDGKAALDQTLDSEPASTFEEQMLMEPTMKGAVSRMSVNSMSGIDLQLPLELRNIQEFFLLMTICNTVVVSAHDHHDNMDASGVVHEDTTDSSNGKKKNGKSKNGKIPNHRKKNNSPYGTFAKKNGTPNGAPLENVNEDAESSVSGEGSSSLETSSVTDITTKLHYEAESPDELALVQASSSYGCKLLKRTPDRVQLWLPGEGEVEMRTLHILPFDSNRKRMSVIVEHPITHKIILYCKGADSSIFTNLKEKTPGDEVEEDLWHNTMDHLTTYAKDGLRTLCMAKRVISDEEYKSWLRVQEAAETALDDRDKLLYEAACQIETNLELLGATGIEDRLQDGVPETIESLRQAGIKVWVLTGDKQETALNIASSCRLISFDQKLIVLNARTREHAKDLIDNHLDMLENRQNPMILGESMRSRSIRSHSIPGETEDNEGGVGFRSSSSQSSLMNGYFGRSKKPEKPQAALVIDGKTLAYALDQHLEQDFLRLANHCNSVLCCRATPFQKSQLVKLVRDNLKKMTLAIGDGANDVAMIQTADVGIGISGQEGMQAVMASDFALARFRFLKRLLLVHGHWCYERLAKMTLYMFYKNAVYIFMLMWFQIFCGFSGGTMVDDFNLMFFNLVYTSLPPILYGVFDRCASDEMLMAYPQLYKRGPKNKAYRKYSYFVAIADATWQSLVEFFIPYFVYIGSGAGYWEFGVTCNAAAVYTTLLHLCIDTKYWSAPHWVGMILSVAVYIVFNMVYGVICTACSPPANPYWVPQYTMGTAIHWFTVLLVIIVALGPRFVVYALRRSLRPGTCERARQLERNPSGLHTHIASGYATWSTSTSSASVVVQAQRGSSTVENGTVNGEMHSPRKREPWKRHRPTNSNGSIGPQNLPKPTSVPNVRIISEAVMTDPDAPTFAESPTRPTQTVYSIETTGQPQRDNVVYSQIPSDHGDAKTSYTNPAYTSHVALSGTHRTESPTEDTDSNINNSCSNLNDSASDNTKSGNVDSPSRITVSDLPPPGGIKTDLVERSNKHGDSVDKQPEVATIQSGLSADDLVNLHSGKSTENLVTHL